MDSATALATQSGGFSTGWGRLIRSFQMGKCTKGQVRRLKTVLLWKGNPDLRQRVQMVLLRESGMT
jgi:hypothetical protein